MIGCAAVMELSLSLTLACFLAQRLRAPGIGGALFINWKTRADALKLGMLYVYTPMEGTAHVTASRHTTQVRFLLSLLTGAFDHPIILYKRRLS